MSKPKNNGSLSKHFIFKYLLAESALWRAAAKDAGAKLYEYIKWKRGMMKQNGWIEVSNVALRKVNRGMNRETKSLALYKLEKAGLIQLHYAPGKAVKVFKPDIKGEYDRRKR